MVEITSEALAVQVRGKIGAGRTIKKPHSESVFRISGGGIAYTIGKVGNGKSFVMLELHQMYKQIQNWGKADRRWFERAMPRRARHDPCNFTAMGALLEYLGHATYNHEQRIYQKPAEG